MSLEKKRTMWMPILLLFLNIAITSGNAGAQEKTEALLERDTLLAAALDIIASVDYCALITLDSNGNPHARTMDPFPPEQDMVVWLGTNTKSRKVHEIRNNPQVMLYYADPGGGGFVTITGIAELVDDPKEKAGRWKDGWDEYFTNREEIYLLIKVVPQKLEVLNYRRGISGDPTTWENAVLEFESRQ